MAGFVWPVAEYLEGKPAVQRAVQNPSLDVLDTLPGILMEPSPLGGQRAQPFVRGVYVNAEGFLHYCQFRSRAMIV